MKVNIGKGIELDVDVARLGFTEGGLETDHVPGHVIYIGLRNILMDAHASITRDTNPNDLQDVSRAVAEKKLNALYAGEVRVAGTREGDPIRAEAIRIGTAAAKAKIRAAGKPLKSVDAKKLHEWVVNHLSQFIDEAKAAVEKRRALSASIGDIEL